MEGLEKLKGMAAEVLVISQKLVRSLHPNVDVHGRIVIHA
jgi:hypothetical protein